MPLHIFVAFSSGPLGIQRLGFRTEPWDALRLALAEATAFRATALAAEGLRPAAVLRPTAAAILAPPPRAPERALNMGLILKMCGAAVPTAERPLEGPRRPIDLFSGERYHPSLQGTF